MLTETNQIEPSHWTEQERWVWGELLEGKIADLTLREPKESPAIEPENSQEWSEKTVLSPSFLQTILLNEPYRKALPRSGVRIIGAWIKESLSLEDAFLSHPWWMQRCCFESEVVLKGLKTPSFIFLGGSAFKGLLNMNSLEVEQHLLMNDKAEFAEVDLGSARVGRQLSMIGSTFKGLLNMNSLEVKQHLFMNDKAEFAEVNLVGARVGGQLCMDGSTFKGVLNMNSLVGGQLCMDGSTFKGPLNMGAIHIARNFFMRNIIGPEEGQEMNLVGTRVGRQLSMTGSIFKGVLNMNSLEVKQHLFMNDKAKFAKVDLGSARVGGQLCMDGSTFKGPMIMGDIHITRDFFMRNIIGPEEGQEVNLVGARVGRQLSMIGSTFKGLLNMNSLEVKQHLFMNDKAEFAKVDLGSARVGRQLSMAGSIFKGVLNMNSLEVKQHLFMNDKAKFAKVDLGSARVGGQLCMDGSTFKGPMIMGDIHITRDFFMRNIIGLEEGQEVNLVGAKVGGQLCMDDSTFKGPLIMEHIHIALDFFMRNIVGPKEGQEVNLISAEIFGSLFTSGSQLPSLNLTGTKIQGELNLDSPIWYPAAKLTLRNTEVGSWQDQPEAWPEILDLSGFSYNQLGGLNLKGENPVTSREVSWFCDWLEKQPDYSPQPYQQLADVLLKSGHRQKSDQILYAGRERERKNAHGWSWGWIWMTLLKWTIGYGYRTWMACVWAIALVGLGVLVLRPYTSIVGYGILDEFFYSLNMLLPGVHLNIPNFDTVTQHLPDAVRYYFYIHTVLGVILGSFLVAGLSGLTKK